MALSIKTLKKNMAQSHKHPPKKLIAILKTRGPTLENAIKV